MEKFRQGEEPAEFAHAAKPAKKIRGYVLTPSMMCGVCSRFLLAKAWSSGAKRKTLAVQKTSVVDSVYALWTSTALRHHLVPVHRTLIRIDVASRLP